VSAELEAFCGRARQYDDVTIVVARSCKTTVTGSNVASWHAAEATQR